MHQEAHAARTASQRAQEQSVERGSEARVKELEKQNLDLTRQLRGVLELADQRAERCAQLERRLGEQQRQLQTAQYVLQNREGIASRMSAPAQPQGFAEEREVLNLRVETLTNQLKQEKQKTKMFEELTDALQTKLQQEKEQEENRVKEQVALIKLELLSSKLYSKAAPQQEAPGGSQNTEAYERQLKQQANGLKDVKNVLRSLATAFRNFPVAEIFGDAPFFQLEPSPTAALQKTKQEAGRLNTEVREAKILMLELKQQLQAQDSAHQNVLRHMLKIKDAQIVKLSELQTTHLGLVEQHQASSMRLADVSQQKQHSARMLEALQKKLEAKEQELSDVLAAQFETQQRSDQLQSQCVSAQQEAQLRTQENASLQSKITEQQQTILQINAEIISGRLALQKQQEENGLHAREAEALREQIKSLQTSLEQKRKQADDQMTQMNTLAASAEQQRDMLNQAVKKAQELDQLKQELKETRRRLEEANTKWQQLEEQLSEKSEAVLAAEERAEEAKKQLRIKQEAGVKLQQELAAVKARVESQEAQLSDRALECKALEDANQSLERELRAKNSILDIMKKQEAEMQLENTELFTQLDSQTEELFDLRKQALLLPDLRAQNAGLKARLERLETTNIRAMLQNITSQPQRDTIELQQSKAIEQLSALLHISQTLAPEAAAQWRTDLVRKFPEVTFRTKLQQTQIEELRQFVTGQIAQIISMQKQLEFQLATNEQLAQQCQYYKQRNQATSQGTLAPSVVQHLQSRAMAADQLKRQNEGMAKNMHFLEEEIMKLEREKTAMATQLAQLQTELLRTRVQVQEQFHASQLARSSHVDTGIQQQVEIDSLRARVNELELEKMGWKLQQNEREAQAIARGEQAAEHPDKQERMREREVDQLQRRIGVLEEEIKSKDESIRVFQKVTDDNFAQTARLQQVAEKLEEKCAMQARLIACYEQRSRQ